MSQVLRIGIVKVGCIGTLPLVEFLIDERAERVDIDIITTGSGAKLGLQECKTAVTQMLSNDPDIVLFIGPAQSARGPKEAREILTKAAVPTIVVSDAPAKNIIKELEESDFGYIIIEADSMIGARREFLDPIEMALYNADVIKILATTGAFRVVVEALDNVFNLIKENKEPILPRFVVDKEKAVKAAGFKNPYAESKAIAAYEISRHVAELNVEACFKVHNLERYVPMVAASHEMIRIAAKLADEAREIEKTGDSVLRKPHFKDGRVGTKRALIKKPKKVTQ